MRLLEKLDPDLKVIAVPKANLKTGNYEWANDMFDALIEQIDAAVTIWVRNDDEPPYGYNKNDPKEMELWQNRRQLGLSWVKSASAHAFAKYLYNMHYKAFNESLMDGTNVQKILHQYYFKRYHFETATIREYLKTLLSPFHVGEGDVVDAFSFILHVLEESVFEFFGSQVIKLNVYRVRILFLRINVYRVFIGANKD